MLPNFIQKSTIVLALALIGLVGGIGTGLHWVFGCSHHCHCSDCGQSAYSQASASSPCSLGDCSSACCHSGWSVGHRRKSSNLSQGSVGSLAESDHDCAICQLLSQFHSSSIDSISLHVVWGNRDSITLSVPEVPTGSSHRLEHPRGPPRDCC